MALRPNSRQFLWFAWLVCLSVSGCSRSVPFHASSLTAVTSPLEPSAYTAAGTATMPTNRYRVSLDFDQKGDAYRDVLGANRAPLFQSGGVAYNVAALIKRFGITQLRLHDAELDVCKVYTDDKLVDVDTGEVLTTNTYTSTNNQVRHVRWSANQAATVDDSRNYDFSKADEQLALVKESGAKLYLRLGESWNGPNDTSDPTSWAKVAVNTYRHVTGAFKPGAVALTPSFVEVFNEPEGRFWEGSASAFFDLYGRTVDRLKLASSVLPPIGGAGFTTGSATNISEAGKFVNLFVPAVGSSRLAFFSAHYYGDCGAATLGDFADWLQRLRTGVDAAGLASRPLHLTEWNIGLSEACGGTFYEQPQLQSFTAGGLILLQDEALNVGAAHYYAAGPMMGLFDPENGKIEIRPGAWSFMAHHSLLNGTKVSAKVGIDSVYQTASEAAKAGEPILPIAVVHDSGVYRAIVVNDSDQDRTIDVCLKGEELANRCLYVYTPPSGTVHLATEAKDGYQVPTSAALSAAAALMTCEEKGLLTTTNGQVTLSMTISARSFKRLEIRPPMTPIALGSLAPPMLSF